MERAGRAWRATVPSEYTQSPYPLQYYFEVRDAAESAGLFPGLGEHLTRQPYFVVRLGLPAAAVGRCAQPRGVPGPRLASALAPWTGLPRSRWRRYAGQETHEASDRRRHDPALGGAPPPVRGSLGAPPRGPERFARSSRRSRGNYPLLYVNVCDETDAVRRHINIFVNESHMRDLDGLDSALAPGDVVDDPSRRLRRLTMPDRVVLTIGTRKGLFVAESAKARGSSRCAARSRRASPSTRHDRHAWHAPHLRLELQSVLRHEGPPLDRPREDVQGNEVGAGIPQGRRSGARQHLVARTGCDTNELWCGVEPASLFRSRDDGDSWQMVDGHQQSPARPQMASRRRRPLPAHDSARRQPHAPRHFDGRPLPQRGRRGDVQARRTRASEPDSTPDPYPEFGQCVHKIVGHKDAPGRLYMQNHGGWGEWDGPGGRRPDIGVLRSDDYGRTWRSIAKGLPSDFGFPIVVHPHDPDTVYVMPLAPATRTCPDGAPAVWRSENGGDSWKRLARGLPEEGELLHRPARRDGHRRAQVAGAVLRNDDRAALDRARRWRGMGAASSTRCRRFTA